MRCEQHLLDAARKLDEAEASVQAARVALGASLRQWRKARGWSLRKCARRAKVDPSMLSRIETGRGWAEPSVLRVTRVLAESVEDRLIRSMQQAVDIHEGTAA